MRLVRMGLGTGKAWSFAMLRALSASVKRLLVSASTCESEDFVLGMLTV